MQPYERIDLVCPIHDQPIISFLSTQEKCLKCLTKNHTSIEELTTQIGELRSGKIQNLETQSKASQIRLKQLKKLFIQISQKFDQQLQSIQNEIDNKEETMKQNCFMRTDELKKPINQLSLKQVKEYINGLDQEQKEDDIFIDQDNEVKEMVLQQYKKSLGELSKIEWPTWEKPNKKIKIEQKNIKYLKKSIETKVSNCFAIDMDQEEKILLIGEDNNITIWEFKNQTLQKRVTLSGHMKRIVGFGVGRNGSWFISGSWDLIIVWIKEKDVWICKQTIEDAHQDWLTGIILTKDDDQFLTYGSDDKIIVWMKIGDQWQSTQKLKVNHQTVMFLSLNQDSNLLASTDGEALRIWERQQNLQWVSKQVINNPVNDSHLRIKFIDSSKIVSTMKVGGIIIYGTNSRGSFQINYQLQLPKIVQQEPLNFPILYSKQLMVVRHTYHNTYIFQKNQNDELMIDQTLEGDYQAGYMSKNGEFLIIHNYGRNCLEVYT